MGDTVPVSLKPDTVRRLEELKSMLGARSYAEVCARIVHPGLNVPRTKGQERFVPVNVLPDTMETLRLLTRSGGKRTSTYDDVLNTALDEVGSS